MPNSARRGAAAVKLTIFWSVFVVGIVLGLAVLGTHPKHLAQEATASVAGIVLDEMADRGLIPQPVPQDTGFDAPQNGGYDAGDGTAPAAAPARPNRPAPSRGGQPTGSGNQTAQATLRYWNGLNDIMAEEAELRRPPAQLSKANADSFLTARIRAGQYAARAMEQLDRRGVDRDVVAQARAIAVWYSQEVAIAQRGRELMGGRVGSAPASRRDTEAYKQEEKAHARRVDEINERSRTLQLEMTRRYGIEFPELL